MALDAIMIGAISRYGAAVLKKRGERNVLTGIHTVKGVHNTHKNVPLYRQFINIILTIW